MIDFMEHHPVWDFCGAYLAALLGVYLLSATLVVIVDALCRQDLKFNNIKP
jgi:hypothetical protein